MDALIELSDENADWKLSFNEFLKCLNPTFNPPEKSRSSLTKQNELVPPKELRKQGLEVVILQARVSKSTITL